MDDGWIHLPGDFLQWLVSGVSHTFPSLGSLVSHRETSFISWGANLKFRSVLCGVREPALSALGGPLHWSVPSRHLADHPVSDGQCFRLPLMQKGPLIYPFLTTPQTSSLITCTWGFFNAASSRLKTPDRNLLYWAFNQLNTCFDVAPVWKMTPGLQLNIHRLAKKPEQSSVGNMSPGV